MIGRHILHQEIRSNELFKLEKQAKLPKQYVHYCDECTYLGRSENGIYDLYIHTDFMNETVIARFDNDPGDYKSGLYLVNIDHDLTQAFKLAQIRNLI